MKIKSTIVIIIFIISIIIMYNLNNTKTKNKILSIGGGKEVAYATWYDENYLSTYNVYIKKTEENKYKKVDNKLIRKYKTDDNEQYWRVDEIGLTEGEYQFKIVPVISQKEQEKDAIITEKITVKPNIREGFSFSENSPNGGKSSGGYLSDGTIPKNAKIIYANKENANNVTLDITKSNGQTIQAKGIIDILAKWKEETIADNLIIRILGMIDRADIKDLDENQSIVVNKCEGVTIEGVGNDATLNGLGIIVKNSSNIEIRNLGIMLFYEDAISLEENNQNIWIHNNDFFYGEERKGDMKKGDGSTDIKSSKYITISYNHYWDSGKTSLCGLENDIDYITYHHNWFDHADSRCPRVRYATVHIYNNYYDEISQYSIGASKKASVFAEANYFKNCKNLMLISKQGTDAEKYRMSGEPGGIIKSFNNIIEGKQNIVYFHEDNIQFDAYLATKRMEPVPKECKTYGEGYTYNNFDIDSDIMYSYNADAPTQIPTIVPESAGRLQGGDINFDTSKLEKFSYNRKDEEEKKLDYLIKNYKTQIELEKNLLFN